MTRKLLSISSHAGIALPLVALALLLFFGAYFGVRELVNAAPPETSRVLSGVVTTLSKNVSCLNGKPGRVVTKKIKGASTQQFVALNKFYLTKNKGRPLTVKQLKSVKAAKLSCKQYATAETVYWDGSLAADCKGATYLIAARTCAAKSGGAEAFKSVASAMKRLGPADTLLLRDGVYAGPVEVTGKFLPEAPLTVKPAPGEHVVVDGQATALHGVLIRGDFVRVSGLTITGQALGGAAIFVSEGTGAIISEVLVSGGSGDGINIGEKAFAVQVNRSVVRYVDGVGIRASAGAHEIRQNLIAGVSGDGIRITPNPAAGSLRVHHNIILGSSGLGIQVDALGALVFNNTILRSAASGDVGVNALVSDMGFALGDPFARGSDSVPDEISASQSVTEILALTGELFALAADSQAIDSGEVVEPLTLDFLDHGVSGNAPDLGAIEFQGIPVLTPTAEPSPTTDSGPGGGGATPTPTGSSVPTSPPTQTATATTTPTVTSTPTQTPTPTPTQILVDGMVVPTPDLSAPTEFARATEFIYTGPDAVQRDVVPSAIKPARVAVMRGKVFGPDGAPLGGVRVTVLRHPEFGYTETRAGGSYDIAVNGGESITLYYKKEGYLPTQRQLAVPIRDFAPLEDLMMVTLDTQTTGIVLDEVTSITPARGSVVSDDAGSRQGTLLVKPGVIATLKFADGTTQPINDLTVRVTEYTVGADGPMQMPGPLPPTSGYTYAAELSVDEAIALGASDIEFSSALPYYVENFLNFPVGMSVPVGYYDKVAGTWKASQNGRVIKILAIDNGFAVLDVTGAGTPSLPQELAALHITDAERQSLATLYLAGQELWRVELEHFTPWDCNWPYGPPSDATAPNQPDPKSEDDEVPDDECLATGSIIGCESQTLREMVPIAGTSMALVYSSARVPGRKAGRRVKVSLSGASVPASLRKIVLEIKVAGQRHAYEFPPQTNQSYIFDWDGNDGYGSPIQGSVYAAIKIGYVYDGVYYEPAEFEKAFAQFSGVPITGSETLQQVTLWQYASPPISNWDFSRVSIGGWSLAPHHVYDPVIGRAYFGDGSTRDGGIHDRIIETIAGTPASGFTGDGGPALEARLDTPDSVALAADGSVFFADARNNRIRKVDAAGIITTVAGNGLLGCPINGEVATETTIDVSAAYSEVDVAVDSQGLIYFAAFGCNKIYRISATGLIQTVAGTGVGDFSGDGGPALNADMRGPRNLAIAQDGGIYFADHWNYRVRYIAPNGAIYSVVGNGDYDFNPYDDPSGMIATSIPLAGITGLAVSDLGALYLSFFGQNVVRVVTPDGIIRKVAGVGGFSGYSGDGGPAVDAQIGKPSGVVVTSNGEIIFTQYHDISGGGSFLRLITEDGTISRFGGTGLASSGSGQNGDGGLPTSATTRISTQSLAIASDGTVVVADHGADRIRRIRSANPHFSPLEIVLPSSDSQELYVFSPSGRHLRTLDTRTNATLLEFEYNSAGKLSQLTDANDNIVSITYDGNGAPTSIVAPFGQTTGLSVNAHGYLSSIEDPAGQTHTFTYTDDGLMQSMTDPRENEYGFEYNALGQLITDTDPRGGAKHLVREAITNGYRVTLNSALGRATQHTVQKLLTGNRVRTVIAPDGTVVQSTEIPDGATTTTTPDGTVSTVVEGPDPRFQMQSPLPTTTSILIPGIPQLNSSFSRTATLETPGNPLSLMHQTDVLTVNTKNWTTNIDIPTLTVTSSTPANRTVSRLIDSLMRTTQLSVPTLFAAHFDYDTFGRLSSMTSGNGGDVRTTTFTYDPAGYLDTIINPLEQVLNFERDAVGRVTAQTLPDGRQILFNYDASGNVTAIGPPGRPLHRFEYTALDQTSQYEPPFVPDSGTPTVFQYDLDRELTRITRPDLSEIHFSYHPINGRILTVESTDDTLTYQYDSAGRVQSITDSAANALTYTFAGPLVTATQWSGAVAGSVQRTFNNFFRVTALKVNLANTIAYGYDDDGFLTSAGATTLTRSPQTGFLAGTSIGSGGNQIAESFAYSGFGEVESYSALRGGSQSLATTTYIRDKLGRITTKSEMLDGISHEYVYSYDVAGRLTAVLRDGAPFSTYTYDENSNRLTHNSTSANYDDQDRLLSYGSESFTYTLNGELASRTSGAGTTTYSYDDFGALRGATLASGTTVEYLLDPTGRRIGRKVNGVLQQGFLYQNALAPIAELDGGGAVVSRFVYGSRANVPDYFIRAGTSYKIVADHLGSPRLVINLNNGAITQRLEYDEFGNVTVDTNPGFQPFGFAGGLYDQATKLVHFGAREYDSTIGRWTTKDPIGFMGGDTNLYGYVVQDPVNYIDPEGTEFFFLFENPPIILRPAVPTLRPPVCGRGDNVLKPDPGAAGPHSTFRRLPDGRINRYQEWRPNPKNPNSGFEPGNRFDGTGGDHGGVPTPHVHDPLAPGGIRPAYPWEFPNGWLS